MQTGSRTQSVRSLSRHSPYASSLPYIQLRARLSLDVWHPVCAWLSTQFAMPTGSRTQSVRSLSRHSPYASSLPYIQLRARLSLDVWHPVCAWLIAYAQKKHRFSGAFNIFIPSKLNKRSAHRTVEHLLPAGPASSASRRCQN